MKVAVIGSGVSGLAATWLLNEHSPHTVHLYESDSRPGGHANTVAFTPPEASKKSKVDVDTGFIVFNPSTYPNFLAFLHCINLSPDIAQTEMTFAISRDHGLFEWAGDTLFTVFVQGWKSVCDGGMWRMMWDVARFNASARRLVLQWRHERKTDGERQMSIGEYLDKEGYSEEFKDNYLIPMTAAIWSTPPDKCAMDFPARTLIQFMNNHHLLQITGKPKWLTIRGGSHKYVNAILSKLPKEQLHLSTTVTAVSTTSGNKVLLTTADGGLEEYDHVIFATHSDTTLNILRAGDGITDEEETILNKFRWSRNEAVLHADASLMPKAKAAWSCWNYLTFSELDDKGVRKANCDKVSLTYGMNALQHIPEQRYGPVLVTLNPPYAPKEELTVGRWAYSHPVIDAAAVDAQMQMRTIQGVRGLSFAGAWLGWGFHEDGWTSGLLAATTYMAATGNKVLPPYQVKFVEGSSFARAAATSSTTRQQSYHHRPGILEVLSIHILVFIFNTIEYIGLRSVAGAVGGLGLQILGVVLRTLAIM